MTYARRTGLALGLLFSGLNLAAQAVAVSKYTTRETVAKAIVANVRAIPTTKFTLKNSDASGGIVQAVRLVRNQELGSLFVLVTQQDESTTLIEATFTRNGGWFGGGDPEQWSQEYSSALKAHIPDLITLVDPALPAPPVESIVAYQTGEVIPLGIADRGMSIDSVEVIRWPKDAAIAKASGTRGTKGEIVVMFHQTNRSGRDYRCVYEITLLDASNVAIGEGRRTVEIEDGEVDDTARVGISLDVLDAPKATKVRIRSTIAPAR
jgi:hypothetical protein